VTSGRRVETMSKDVPPPDRSALSDHATGLVRRIVREGVVAFSDEALEMMRSEGLTTADCHNVLRWGISDPPSRRGDMWRYRLHTAAASVVVIFRSEAEIVVLSAERKPR
jgi:hypothetical protein